jgi:hypothetical protein
MKPWLLPSGLQSGIPFIIPDHWTPEQALAVVGLLDDLSEMIWNHYQVPLYEQLRVERCTNTTPDSCSTEETDPPF